MESIARFVRRLRYGRPIVVVSGLPRSGTSMMMQMLHAGGLEIVTDSVRTADGSNPKGYFELEAVKDLDKGAPPAWLPDARGKAVKIVSSLVRWLPESHDYLVIFMQRNLDEVIVSQDRMLAERGVSQDAGKPERIRQLYQDHVEETLRLLSGRRCFSTLVVDYGETLAQPERIARRLDRFLGGRLDVARAAAAADPALYRNRPHGERSVMARVRRFHLTQVPLTLPSHASLFTGLYPAHHAVRDNGGFVLGNESTTLAERFVAAGYKTAAYVLHSSWGIGQLLQRMRPPV